MVIVSAISEPTSPKAQSANTENKENIKLFTLKPQETHNITSCFLILFRWIEGFKPMFVFWQILYKSKGLKGAKIVLKQKFDKARNKAFKRCIINVQNDSPTAFFERRSVMCHEQVKIPRTK